MQAAKKIIFFRLGSTSLTMEEQGEEQSPDFTELVRR